MFTDSSWKLEYSFQSFLICTIIIFVCHATWTHLRHPLRHFPGPRLAAWSDIPYCYWLIGGRQPFILLELHEKYGPVVRVAPNELSFNTATSWKDIYGYRPGHRAFVKSKFYDGGPFVKRFGTRSLVNTQDPTEHGKMRRYLSHAFSEKSLREQETIVAEEVDKLVEKLGEFGAAENGTNLQRWLNMATFDIVGSLSFGKSFDALQNGRAGPTETYSTNDD
jgi:cytochrome P450